MCDEKLKTRVELEIVYLHITALFVEEAEEVATEIREVLEIDSDGLMGEQLGERVHLEIGGGSRKIYLKKMKIQLRKFYFEKN